MNFLYDSFPPAIALISIDAFGLYETSSAQSNVTLILTAFAISLSAVILTTVAGVPFL